MAKKIAFIICPIGDEHTETRLRSDWLMREVIEPELADFDYRAIRADKIDTPGMISRQIIELCLSCDLVVADLTDSNPNVFYEYGIAHHAQRPEITFMLAGQRSPFDTQDMRAIPYHPWMDAKITREKLKSCLKEVQSQDYKVMNPVVRTINEMRSLQGKKTDEAKAIVELNRRVERLEASNTNNARRSALVDYAAELSSVNSASALARMFENEEYRKISNDSMALKDFARMTSEEQKKRSAYISSMLTPDIKK